MSINKDWTKEDNFSEFDKTKAKEIANAPARVLDEMITSALVSSSNPKKVGATVERFKRNASPEQLEAMKNITADNIKGKSAYEKYAGS